MKIFGREPAMWMALLTALVGLAVSFGLDLTEGQHEAIHGIGLAVLTLVSGVLVRSAVSPVAKT